MRKINPRLLTILILAILFGLALFLRVYFPFDKVFTNVGIKFTSSDAYYHMRLADNLVHNFPSFTGVDPFAIFSGSTGGISIRFFGWLIAIPAWIIGFGSPSQNTIDMVGAYLPAVLGSLTVIPVYFIGRELFGKWAGFLSAALIVIMPGEFIGRSIIGFTDYHIAEALFTTITIMFLIFAIKAAYLSNINFSHVKKLDWTALKKPLTYSLLAGLFMGIYIFTWAGALLFVFIIFIYIIIQFIIDHLKGKSTESLAIVSGIFFLTTLILSMLVSANRLYFVSILIALLVPLVLSIVSGYMTKREMRPAYYLLAISGLGVAALGIFYLITPSLFAAMINAFSLFNPTGAQLTTIEMQKLIGPQYGNPLVIAWGNFSTGFFISFISLAYLIYLMIKRPDNAERGLLVVWSIVILVATLNQRRFGYYYAVNVALLAGYFSWKILEIAGIRETFGKSIGALKDGVTRRISESKASLAIRWVNISLTVIVVFFVVYFWNIGPAINIAGSAPYAPSNAWVTSLKWMRENTPEPFEDPEAYSGIFELPASGQPFEYPESAYGVLSWWDYGYWITRIAHRIPNANPSQDPDAIRAVAAFFTSQNEQSAKGVIDPLGSKYIVIDYESAYVSPATASGKFAAISIWADKNPAQFYEIFLIPQDTGMINVVLYHPDYFQSMAVRLYNFDGQAVVPEQVTVISYEEQFDAEGRLFKIVNFADQFTSYQDAVNFINKQESPSSYQIVSTNPMSSPVPLEAVENYSLVYSSDGTIMLPDAGLEPIVKIFEYNN